MAAKRTIGTIADEILALDAKIKKSKEVTNALEEQRKPLEEELRTAAEKENQTGGKGKKSKWDIKPNIVPQATNWDDFYAYISENKYFHLLQRRPAVLACQELWSQGTAIPGIEKFTSMKVSVKGVD